MDSTQQPSRWREDAQKVKADDIEDVSDDADAEDDLDRQLKQGVSVASLKVNPYSNRRFIVRPEMYHDIIMRLRVPYPAIDAFGCKDSNKCRVYWGKGGAAPSAWSQNWSYEKVGLLWANPPFNVNDLYDIVHKCYQQDAQMVIVVPDWPQYPYYEMLWNMAKAYHYYGPGSHLFDKRKKNLEQFGWGVWAVHLHKPKPEDKFICLTEAQQYQRNPSSRRRYRRKALQKDKGKGKG